MAYRTSRRTFLTQSTALGAGLWVTGAPRAFSKSPNEKLNVGAIGAGGRGRADLQGVKSENVIALCDVDEKRASASFKQFPKASKYSDFRKMLEKEAPKLDAVTVATPDHTHAVASVMAMREGLHCYCEKPLTWSPHEARTMAEVAKEEGVVTQMGNQGSASSGFRRGVEMLHAGVLGPVTEAHIWTNRPVWPQAKPTPTEWQSPPKTLDWDKWLSVASWRPYHDAYLPFKWRGWYDFGTGAIGDMACHTVNLTYRGLKLGLPETIEVETTERYPDAYPAGSKITFHFPAREDLPPVKLTWYSGTMQPPKDLLPDRWLETDKKGNKKLPGSGALLIGEKGKMLSPDDYGRKQRYEPKELADFDAPRTLPRTPGHHLEFLRACKGESETYSNFEFAGPFTEAMVLGVVAIKAGQTIEYDTENIRAKNLPQAKHLMKREYRKGYSL